MDMTANYSATDTEKKWYQHWMSKGYFRSTPDEREPYTIVIPPPNVTGVLHMGHMLNNTIQDILIRKARMEGKNACWVPGTDHASIATEAKVVKMLRERGIKKSDISREEFLKYAFEWKDKYGGIILDQLKMLGSSCDWERTRFTMEPSLSRAVIKSFTDLYQKGLIYRGKRITNWDPEALTVLSNEEVIYSEENSKLYFVRYKIEGAEDEYITVATVRPETIMGDTGICVHPSDERYLHLHGKRAIVPLINRSVPVITDHYIDPEFGTGALKVTPAHDQNDYEIGQKHGLEVIDVLNENGTLSEAAQILVGEDRFIARKKIIPLLEEAGALVKIEEYKNKVGRSERTNAIVEPRLSLQWFLKMKELAGPALEAVESGDIQFYPDNFKNLYRNWMENIRDWCISRQLWWGQQIPAWYYTDSKGEVHTFVAETEVEALAAAQQQFPNITSADLTQDEDVVDTWFSSWLWPIAVFDGFESQKEIDYYYPTNVLVTGWDIMFFWVARMVMAGFEWKKEKPFKDVYFTGMVRDQLRRKMSKSLGNSPDSLELIGKYGADGVRFGMLASSPAGGDLIFDAPFDKDPRKFKDAAILNESLLCEQGSKFCNKIWNALKLLKGFEVDASLPEPIENRLATKWFEQKYQETIAQVNQDISNYRLAEALKTLYNLIWTDFCSWYLEWIKPEYGKPIDTATLGHFVHYFEKLLTLLHPFMPFVTEEVWHRLKDRADGDDCMMSQWPTESGAFDKAFLYDMEMAMNLVSRVREERNNNKLKPKEPLKLFVKDSDSARKLFANEGLRESVAKLAFLESLEFTKGEVAGANFVVGTEQYYLHFEKQVDFAAEERRLEAELEQARGFVTSVNAKLKNKRFLNNAKEEIVLNERKKLTDGKMKVRLLESAMSLVKSLSITTELLKSRGLREVSKASEARGLSDIPIYNSIKNKKLAKFVTTINNMADDFVLVLDKKTNLTTSYGDKVLNNKQVELLIHNVSNIQIALVGNISVEINIENISTDYSIWYRNVPPN